MDNFHKYNNAFFPSEQFELIKTIKSNWKIENLNFNFIFREAHPINEIDEVFCGLLSYFEGSCAEGDFAHILGFSVTNDFEQKIYADDAEKHILDEMLKECALYNLLVVDKEKISLTEDGKLCLESKLKYRYWEGENISFFYNHCAYDNLLFDFKETFNLSIKLPNKRKCKEIKAANNLENDFFDLAKFQLSQSSENKYELWNLEPSKNKNISNELVQYSTYKDKNNDCIVLVSQNDVLNVELSDIINDERNLEFKKEIILKCEFQAFLDDENSIIDLPAIIKFEKLWKSSDLISDKRLKWTEENIWEYFENKYRKSEWTTISQYAPIEEIKNRLGRYIIFDWIILTERFDDDYIYDTLFREKYHWDFEILSSRDIDFVWLLINSINNRNNRGQDNIITANWDFISITEKLSDERIFLLILQKMPLDFIQISSRSPEFILTCIKEIASINRSLNDDDEKYKVNFDWKKVVNEWSIASIWNNIELLQDNINWHQFLVRAFSDEQYSNIFTKSKAFKEKLVQFKDKVTPTFRTEKLIWTEQLIDLFQELELIYWTSNSFVAGFDCNSHVEWTIELLKKYATNFTTNESCNFLSSYISSWEYVEQIDIFEWNWDILSTNEKLIFNTEILNKYQDFLNWELLSKRFDDDFILANLLDFNWDFHYLSSSRNLDFIEFALGLDSVIAKDWDWKYLSKNLSIEFITQKLTLVGHKWDWKHLTQNVFSKEEIINLWTVTVEYWDWKYIIDNFFNLNIINDNKNLNLLALNLNKLENEENKKDFWLLLTKKMLPEYLAFEDYRRLKSEMYNWDWSYLSNHPRFDYTITFVAKFQNKWDWNVLSKNSKINYHWDYVKRFKRFWNWAYLSEKSNFMFSKRKLSLKIIEEYIDVFDFYTFSKRNDIQIDNELIDIFSSKNWDFGHLSSLNSIRPEQRFLRKYESKNWDWAVLSSRKDLKVEIRKDEDGKEIIEKFINELILEFQDKGWDWQALSNRKDINFTYNLFSQLLDKDWNFYTLSKQRKDIVWSKELLHILKDKGIDWAYLSEKNAIQELNADYINTFVTYWDWELLSNNEKFVLDEKLLLKYQDKWNYKNLTKRKEVLANSNFLFELIDKDWNWQDISRSSEWKLDKITLDKLKDKLDWRLISSNSKIVIDVSLLEQFENYWDFVTLNANSSRLSPETKKAINQYFSKRPKLKFLLEIDRQSSSWKGSIYHFSHLSNAVKILKDMAIKSRNTARQINNSAGSVVNSRDTAKDYARFYFRPHTPAQFYNENLGKSPSDDYLKTWIYNRQEYSSWKREYSKAANMGFPKCPVPIFFKIDISEVLNKYFDNCYISNGNMQSNSAQIFNIKDGISNFDFNNVYTESSYEEKDTYKNASQQEFLVLNQLDLTNLKSLEIICQNEEDKVTLINLIGEDHPFADKVKVNSSGLYHHRKHSRYDIEKYGNELSINTNFSGNLKTVVKLDKLNCTESIEGDIHRVRPYLIEGGRNMTIKFNRDDVNYQVCYIDESNQEWLLNGTSSFD